MKSKSILKFVSLLGVGSFVSLAAASCTQSIVPVTNSSTSTSNQDSSSSRTTMTDRMSDSDPSSGDSQEMNTPEQQLAAARQALTDLLNTESNNIALYSDYAVIQNTLKSAYETAKKESENANATLEDIKSVETTLKTAISKAESEKRAFDSANQPLVTAYNELKTTLQSNKVSLDGLSENKYSAIKNKVSSVFDVGSGILTHKLDSLMGENLGVENITKANQDIKDALENLAKWKQNADEFDNFKKNRLSEAQLTRGTDSAQNQAQPSNWSFVGYSADVTGSNLQNLSFVQRKVWMSDRGTTSPVASPVLSTDVSWIYSFAGEGTKYTLKFTYYGPSIAYLYFPYKLVKNADSSSLALQYKLNDSNPKAINFQSTQTASANSVPSHGETSPDSAPESGMTPETPVADEMTTSNNATNPIPTVSDINVAKIKLTDLIFGENTLEFSLPTDMPAKVSPMIGNMYLTSNSESEDKIYNEIFGNTNENDTSVTVDLLKGYGLTSAWSIYVGEFKNLMRAGESSSNSHTDTPSYLVGFIAGPSERVLASSVRSPIKTPAGMRQNRTYTIYVNAPQVGDYYISGSYISSMMQRSLKFQTGDTANAVTINVTSTTSFSTLERFNTGDMGTSVVMSNQKSALNLKKGLNKIIISGNNDTPFIGNLTFTLNNAPTNDAGSENM
ncbi:FIVAR domain-containing protein [Mycoplasma tullyi]|uniref:FIVAR domain-containing protein n=1 Tax=Mycoplasma tullyi TaxID=1612150 RepID=A0A7D7XV26_9MOLU|nr:FIVAR domain-containing protein [Mycoplasma tullyi]QMT98434.1 FIVAR domain-containing protein [Mycoplasma tullyi]